MKKLFYRVSVLLSFFIVGNFLGSNTAFAKPNIHMLDDVIYAAAYNPYFEANYGQGVYYVFGEVRQIISQNAVLVSVMHGGGPLIYLQTSNAKKLQPYDRFYPFVPIKYLGKNYTYRNYLGGIDSVPMFRDVLPKEYNRLESEKGALKDVYVINEQDPYSKEKLYRSGY